MEFSIDTMLNFLMVTASSYRQSLTISPVLSKPLNNPKMYCGIHDYLPHPSFYLQLSTYPNQTQSKLCKTHNSETVIHKLHHIWRNHLRGYPSQRGNFYQQGWEPLHGSLQTVIITPLTLQWDSIDCPYLEWLWESG